MHVDPRRPNILQDKLAASRGLDLASPEAKVKRMFAKARIFPYSSERQNSRAQRVSSRKAST